MLTGSLRCGKSVRLSGAARAPEAARVAGEEQRACARFGNLSG